MQCIQVLRKVVIKMNRIFRFNLLSRSTYRYPTSSVVEAEKYFGNCELDHSALHGTNAGRSLAVMPSEIRF